MDINLQTKIALLLEAYPTLEETLLELSPAFAKLRNPILRKTVGKVTSLQQAAKIAGISPALMVQTLRKAAGLSSVDIEIEDNNDSEEAIPTWFGKTKITIRFDATPTIDAGQNPMQEIIQLAAQLNDGEIMELTAPFKPVPIIDTLKAKGFSVLYRNEKTYITLR